MVPESDRDDASLHARRRRRAAGRSDRRTGLVVAHAPHALHARRLMQPETFSQLKKLLTDQRGRQNDAGNVLFYLAVADRFFGPIVEQLGRAGLARQSEKAWRRVIIEKPFGHDFASAEALNAQILRYCPRTRSTASIISSAKKPSRTFWCCASPMVSSSRCGVAIMSTTCMSV